MINTEEGRIIRLSVHFTGNKTNGEELIVSREPMPLDDSRLQQLLMQYFLGAFSRPEYYHFTFSNGDFEMNPVYQYAAQIFDSPGSFHTQSVNLAKHLYECADHPNIKPGDLFVVHLEGVNTGQETADVIALFKSEQKQSFLRLLSRSGGFDLEADAGINIDKPDKGCLIINSDRDKGFKICILDKANKAEAQYWKDTFLQLKPCADEYHQTSSFLDVARNFVTQQFPEDFEVSKADQIDLLNRSVAYFKDHDTFEKEGFEQEVFGDERIIKSFREFDQNWRDEHELELPDSFEISAPALKKQMRVFKSVLKLDKNFHIYIHGDRDLIEQGRDPDGRKYYKIYFEEEA